MYKTETTLLYFIKHSKMIKNNNNCKKREYFPVVVFKGIVKKTVFHILGVHCALNSLIDHRLSYRQLVTSQTDRHICIYVC